MNISNSTIAFSSALFLTIALCVFFAFRWIDTSISLTYLQASYDSRSESSEIISSLLLSEWRGLSERDVVEKIEEELGRKINDNVLVIDKNSEIGVIWINQVRFEFSLEGLEAVKG